MAKIVLFVDALEPREIGGTRFKETQRGLVDSGAPKVTPKVTSEVHTGLDPTQTGMGGQHSIKGERQERPMAPAIQEKLEQAGYNVFSYMMPYIHPLQLQNQAFVSDTMQGPQPGQSPIAQMCVNPPAVGDLMEPEDDGEFAWNSRTDEIYARSSSMLNAIRAGDFDVAFIGIRSPDQYTHFQWHEEYRRKLLEDIAYEIQRWEVNHDVLWWSDHGSEEKKETFRVNKWLMDKGYLDIDVDLEFNERFKEEARGMQNGGDAEKVDNQIAIHSPGVEVNDETEALCADPYDSCIDVMDDSLDRGELIADLMDSGYYKRVEKTEDEWGDGQFRDQCPDIVTLRADNVLVTGNVHPEPIGMGFHRTGVHSAYGAWGTTDESFEREGDVIPRTLHDVIWEFVTGSSQIEQSVQQQLNEMEEHFREMVDT
jgi:hypothetical protein